MQRRRRLRERSCEPRFCRGRYGGEALHCGGRGGEAEAGSSGGNEAALNTALRATEGDLLSPEGLPKRPWFKHTIYAPGEYTGYAAVVIPGVNEAIDAKDAQRGQAQLAALTAALIGRRGRWRVRRSNSGFGTETPPPPPIFCGL